MIRIAHRIQQHPLQPKTSVPRTEWDKAHWNVQKPGTLEEIQRELLTSTVLIADNCAEAMYSKIESSHRVMQMTDLPFAIPPIDNLVIEYLLPSFNLWDHSVTTAPNGARCYPPNFFRAAAVHIRAIPPELLKSLGRPTTERRFFGHIIMETREDRACYYMTDSGFTFAVDDEGKLLKDELTGLDNNNRRAFLVILQPAFFALALCHMKNITTADVTKSLGPRESWLRKHRVPQIRYHILQIDAAKKLLKTQGDSDRIGIANALHLVRGHFATYSPEKPLFGIYVGTVWKPAHARGDVRSGMVVKDYAIQS